MPRGGKKKNKGNGSAIKFAGGKANKAKMLKSAGKAPSDVNMSTGVPGLIASTQKDPTFIPPGLKGSGRAINRGPFGNG